MNRFTFLRVSAVWGFFVLLCPAAQAGLVTLWHNGDPISGTTKGTGAVQVELYDAATTQGMNTEMFLFNEVATHEWGMQALDPVNMINLYAIKNQTSANWNNLLLELSGNANPTLGHGVVSTGTSVTTINNNAIAIYYPHPAGPGYVPNVSFTLSTIVGNNLLLRTTPNGAPPGPVFTHGSGSITTHPGGWNEGGYTTDGMLPGTVAPTDTFDVNSIVPAGGFVTLTAKFDPGLGYDPESCRLYVWNTINTEWQLAGKWSNTNASSGNFIEGPPTLVLGDWGVDIGKYMVWANVDHASTYAAAGTPEPATLSLLALGGLAMIRRRRQR
jgi:hypothetical protein